MQLNESKLIHVGNNIYREEKPTGQRRYYLKSKCAKCNQDFFTDRYRPSLYCSQPCAGIRIGRPFGSKPEEEVKKIVTTMTGRSKFSIEERIKRGNNIMNKELHDKLKEIADIYKVPVGNIYSLALRYFLRHGVNEDKTLKEGDNK